jgi:hypothetical protein
MCVGGLTELMPCPLSHCKLPPPPDAHTFSTPGSISASPPLLFPRHFSQAHIPMVRAPSASTSCAICSASLLARSVLAADTARMMQEGSRMYCRCTHTVGAGGGGQTDSQIG